MQSKSRIVVVLGTGGTIAGLIGSAGGAGYRAAQLGVQALVSGLPAEASVELEAEQLAQIDSKDMTFEVWARLAERVTAHLTRSEVVGVVITHGTDTLEETAYFLRRVLQPSKPVVLTAAMRPADSPEADGPRNLQQAVDVAGVGGWGGVAVVVHDEVHDALWVRKAHPRAIRAFDSGERGPLAVFQNGSWIWHRQPDEGHAAVVKPALPNPDQWPWVELVHSHAGARGETVKALVVAGVHGLVVVATGNGTVHQALESALTEAVERGVRVWRASRCIPFGLEPQAASKMPGCELIPSKTRVALMLDLIARP